MRETMDQRMHVVVVPAPRAEDVRRQLHARGLIDRSMKMRKRDGEVHIPILAEPPSDLSLHGGRVATMDGLEPRARPRYPRELLRERCAEDGIPSHLLPRRWERIGDVVVLRLAGEARDHAARIGRIFGEMLGATTVVEDVSGIHGPLRVPEVRVLWGDGTETVHMEGRVRYKLDVARVMFSSGNLTERTSIAGRVRAGETVVDLFAGIGYFSLPIALRARPSVVYACELNPTAFAYLEENIRLNRADRVVPILGDCRATAPRGVADWVLMGHFAAIEYLDVGLACLRDDGMLIVHAIVPKEAFPEGLAHRVRSDLEGLGAAVEHVLARKVKFYAPGIVHGAVEVHTTTEPKGISGATSSGGR